MANASAAATLEPLCLANEGALVAACPGAGSLDMHELGLTMNIVAICEEHAAGRKVTRVRLELGTLSAVMADALRFCFDVVAAGTVVEGATLEIVEVVDGRDLAVKEMEVE
jgi:hypothetical protein